MDKLQAMYKNQIAPAMEKADKSIVDKIPQTKLFQDKGVPPSVVVAGVGVVSAIIFAFIIGGAGLCNIVGFVFPVIGSFKALKSDGKEDDTNWLTYWVVYNFFNVVESITDILFEWIPLYYLGKCAFLVWCFLPQFQGANVIYKHGLEPLLDKFIPQIEKASLSNVAKVEEVVRSVSSEDTGQLNVPMVATVALDYAMGIGLSILYYSMMANEKYTPIMAAVAMGFIAAVLTSREWLYWLLLSPYFAKAKVDFKMPSWFWQDIVSTITFFMVTAFAGTYFGVFHFEVNGWKTLLLISFEFWGMALSKDWTSMKFAHPWMHKKENYWLHKRHHTGNKDTGYVHSLVFDLRDVFIENTSGALFQMVANYLLFGSPAIHMASFMFLVWGDGNVHSMNPYTVITFNPVADWLMKPNLTHQLHHAVQLDYYEVYPIYMLWDSKRRQADIDKYNKILKTNVNFSLFI